MDSESTLDLSTKRFLCPPIHPKGYPFIILASLVALLVLGGFATGWFLTERKFLFEALFFLSVVPMVLLVYGVAIFFRNWDRFPPSDLSVIVSPADGIVSLVKQTPPPPELDVGDRPVWRISVFMSVLNMHVNRMPMGGTIEKKRYVPGKFVNASLDKASKDNERQLYWIRLDDGSEMGVVQIAGLVARRIVSFVKEGDHLDRGQRFGLIRFGSRLDIYLPEGVEPLVSLGQTMVCGETALAKREVRC